MDQQEFVDACAQHQVVLTKTQEAQFEQYYQLLVEWNEKMNLTAITDRPGVYAKHFYDSVLPAMRLGLNAGSLCDVGAGAGFPSIPMKIVFPALHITILEPLQKRCVFLTELVSQLKLENVTIHNVRAEEYGKANRECFDVVSARAVANLSMLAELCIPLVKKQGIFLSMKGSSGMEEATAAKQAIALLGCELETSFEEQVGDHTHINLVYRKVKETPRKYPRIFAQIKKNPL